jgi:hypothetical protein
MYTIYDGENVVHRGCGDVSRAFSRAVCGKMELEGYTPVITGNVTTFRRG